MPVEPRLIELADLHPNVAAQVDVVRPGELHALAGAAGAALQRGRDAPGRVRDAAAASAELKVVAGSYPAPGGSTFSVFFHSTEF